MHNILRPWRMAVAGSLLFGIFNAQLSSVFAQGGLTPPGAPAPTMKSLDQVQPRMPITSLPFTISTSGAFYLSTNVSTTGNGLTISASDVDLDLNGFAMTGGSGSGAAIFVNGTRTNISVRNGSIRSFGSSAISAANLRSGKFSRLLVWTNSGGITAGADAVIENCTVVDNGTGNDAINVGPNSMVTHCEARRGFRGIVLGGGTVKDCLVVSNSNSGILGTNATVEGCMAVGNGTGIDIKDGSSVRNCDTLGNGNGIITGQYCHVMNCNSYSNSSAGISVSLDSTVSGCTATKNGAEGILGGDSCRITENTCAANGVLASSAGIHVTGTFNRIEANNCVDNTGNGIKVDISSSNLIIRNSCSGSYSVPAGNLLGPILSTSTQIGTNTNPHANYLY